MTWFLLFICFMLTVIAVKLCGGNPARVLLIWAMVPLGFIAILIIFVLATV